MKVIVHNNQIESAIRHLKKKLTKEGFFSEIKERRFYDKPSVQKKKKQAKAAKRRRKSMRKFHAFQSGLNSQNTKAGHKLVVISMFDFCYKQ